MKTFWVQAYITRRFDVLFQVEADSEDAACKTVEKLGGEIIGDGGSVDMQSEETEVIDAWDHAPKRNGEPEIADYAISSDR